MLNYDVQIDEGTLVLMPEGQLDASDFKAIAKRVNSYLAARGPLRGVLIVAKSFPDWKNFGALIAHLKLLKRHHRKIAKVAVVAESDAAAIMPQIASHFPVAELRHYTPKDEVSARVWLGSNVDPYGKKEGYRTSLYDVALRYPYGGTGGAEEERS